MTAHLAQARSIAQAELDLIAARPVARVLLSQLCGLAPGSDPASTPQAPGGDDARIGTIQDVKRVERYVRRSQARRDRLIRLCLLGQG
jgi:hypothetical protein